MTSDQMTRLRLRHATLIDGTVADVTIESGSISHVRTGTCEKGDASAGAARDMDISGYILLPAPVEPHAHLDKALLGSRVRNDTEDLAGAISAIQLAYESMTDNDIERRSLAALKHAVMRGFTAVRTHLDCRTGIGSRSVRVLAELKEELRDTVDLQIVALAGFVTDDDGAESRALLLESLRHGADLVGGCPSLEPDQEASAVEFLAIARDHEVGLDLHLDETTDTQSVMLRYVAERVIDTDFRYPVTASHCVSLGMQDPVYARETAERVAEAGIGVVTLPQTNLYLQGRAYQASKPRGITALATLAEAGVTVAGGGDNWRDPFNPIGRIDAMETASLLVSAGHLLVADAYESVSARARSVMGLSAVEVAAGYPADLLAIRGESLADAMGSASEERIVIKGGRVISRTTVESVVAPELAER